MRTGEKKSCVCAYINACGSDCMRIFMRIYAMLCCRFALRYVCFRQQRWRRRQWQWQCGHFRKNAKKIVSKIVLSPATLQETYTFYLHLIAVYLLMFIFFFLFLSFFFCSKFLCFWWCRTSVNSEKTNSWPEILIDYHLLFCQWIQFILILFFFIWFRWKLLSWVCFAQCEIKMEMNSTKTNYFLWIVKERKKFLHWKINIGNELAEWAWIKCGRILCKK